MDGDGRPLHERVAALERTVTDGHADEGLPDAARMDGRLDDLEATVDDLGDQVAELDAAVQALRGFAGGVQAVDEAVERQADAAIARVDRLETELDDIRERMSRRDDETHAETEPKECTRVDLSHDGTHTDARSTPPRPEPNVADERGVPGDGGAGHGGYDRGRACDHGDSVNDVAARTDAALADAAAMTDEVAEADGGRSLADRIRGLL